MNPRSKEGTGTLFPIVGIGASAGGLEPLEEMFTHLPTDVEMAIIIIVHSDPSHETLLPTILASLSTKQKKAAALSRNVCTFAPQILSLLSSRGNSA